MSFFRNRAALLVGALLATSACGGYGAVPSHASASSPSLQLGIPQERSISPDDNTSILKKLKKNVVIGSTVDPTNGDTGPRAIAQALISFGLKKGQLIVCNFADTAGTAGKGTTANVLDPTPGSKPATFVQSSKIQGCDGDALSSGNSLFGAGLRSHIVAKFNQNGKYAKTYGPPIEAPLTSADAFCGLNYAPEGIYVGDSKTGAIIKFAPGLYGNPKEVEVITGFAVNKGSGWGVLGPSGIQYNGKLIGTNRCNDTLYIADGADNTIVAASKASNLLVKGEIEILPGGKTFKCKQKRFTCATLVYSGSPLNAPVALALLPNGNLIAANTKGGNRLVEISSSGKLLGTKLIDASSAAHVFGLVASGTNDGNTVLFYTDTKDNSVHELEE
jgi:hypothetical protein